LLERKLAGVDKNLKSNEKSGNNGRDEDMAVEKTTDALNKTQLGEKQILLLASDTNK
jgi:hypothetical protein